MTVWCYFPGWVNAYGGFHVYLAILVPPGLEILSAPSLPLPHPPLPGHREVILTNINGLGISSEKPLEPNFPQPLPALRHSGVDRLIETCQVQHGRPGARETRRRASEWSLRGPTSMLPVLMCTKFTLASSQTFKCQIIKKYNLNT